MAMTFSRTEATAGMAIVVAAVIGVIWHDLHDDIEDISASWSETAKTASALDTIVAEGFEKLSGKLDAMNETLEQKDVP